MQLRSTDLVSKKKNDPSSEFKWPAGAFCCIRLNYLFHFVAQFSFLITCL